MTHMQMRFNIVNMVILLVLLATVSYGVVELTTPLTKEELQGRLDSDPALYYSLGTFLASEGLFQEAQATLQHSLSLEKDARTYYNLGYTLYEQGMLDQVNDAFLQATWLDPGYVKAWDALGIIALETEHYEDAIAYLERTVTLDKDDARAWFDLGLAYAALFRSGDDASYATLALDAFRQASALDPGWQEAAGNVDVLEQFV